MDILSIFTVHFILLALAVYAIIEVIKRSVNYFPKAKESKLWNKVILPILAILIGGLLNLWLCIIPPVLAGVSSKMFFPVGLVAGLFSSFIYGRVRGLLKSELK